MHEILVRRVQHPVGQGGFHMADMRVANKPFRYIYDCGSSNPGAISALLKGLGRSTGEKEFDWLVISSFDMDHCNGVALLLAEGYTFKRVFLPHRLDNKLLVWLLCCYVLDERSAKEITDALASLRILRELYDQFGRDGDGPDDMLERLTPDPAKPNAVNVTYHVKEADWMFRFYSRETNYGNLVKALFDKVEFAQLKAIMKRAAKTVSGSAKPRDTVKILADLFSVLGKPPAQAQAGNGAAPSGPSVKKLLGNAYENLTEDDARVFGDYNEVSLCLYAGPRTSGQSADRRFSVQCTVGHHSDFPARDWTRRAGWLGLGDIGFRNRALLDELALYYRSELALSCTKMVPHHGAQSNYGTLLPMLAPFFALDAMQTLWVAAAYPLTRYRHPAGVVVLESEKNGTFVMVSDDPGSRIEETVRSIPSLALSGSSVRYLIHLLRKAGYR
ncbi:hypothetical protein CR152_24985 [Massilia violaceinigra]|uniref:Metallo-beta-lactamase domain-containing protein n=1 Tax=Massilia violaceinigra TaxID=2045208 RepID=A0A2D2DQY9_9BURK|nr:hypothetical protein [Massilia violaceinigra]ATQ77390.1 hypothetical protein CR152_24985 [Massilia violaceinigra]